jgi:LysR family glycine cleavage system transcriptional activator
MAPILHLRALQAVELAARTGSLKAAAAALGITPAAAGQRVKALEDYLGVELFVRGRAGLLPTAALVEALPHLGSGFRDLERAQLFLEIQRGRDLRIAAEPDFADLWLKPRLDRFQARHPNIAISVNGEGAAGFRAGPADCEIRFEAPAAGLERLFDDFLLPVASPDILRRLSLKPEAERLEGFPLLHIDFYRNDPAAPGWPEWAARHALTRSHPERGVRFLRIARGLDALLADAGIAICGLALLAEPLEDERLRLPFPMSAGVRTSHAFHARFRGEARPHVQRFRQWLLAEAAVSQAWLDARIAGG